MFWLDVSDTSTEHLSGDIEPVLLVLGGVASDIEEDINNVFDGVIAIGRNWKSRLSLSSILTGEDIFIGTNAGNFCDSSQKLSKCNLLIGGSTTSLFGVSYCKFSRTLMA